MDGGGAVVVTATCGGAGGGAGTAFFLCGRLGGVTIGKGAAAAGTDVEGSGSVGWVGGGTLTMTGVTSGSVGGGAAVFGAR